MSNIQIDDDKKKEKKEVIYDDTYKPYIGLKPYSERELDMIFFSCSRFHDAMTSKGAHGFFWDIMSRTTRGFTTRLPTAGVYFDAKNHQLVLSINPYFLRTLNKNEIEFVMYHEMMHVVDGHLTSMRRTPHNIANIAMDLKINSVLFRAGYTPPKFLYLPGIDNYEKYKNDPDYIHMIQDSKKEDVEFMKKFHGFIGKLPVDKNEDFYFYAIMRFLEEEGGGGAKGQQSLADMLEKMKQHGIGNEDDHEGWSLEDNEYMGEIFKDYIKGLVEKAQDKNSWGSLPQDYCQELKDKYLNYKINGRSIIRYFVGSRIKSHFTSSFSRVNRRFPYLHPGKKKDCYAKIGVFIDQSGSMNNEYIELIYAVLGEINKNVEFDIIPFDTEIDVNNIFTLNKNSKKDYKKRTKCGGTNFQCVVDYVLETKKYEGYMIFTDGECDKPDETKIKRMWVTMPNHKLMFETNDIVISIEDLK